ncbi:hypothetical protein SRHO_G00284500 [Serrasalmus rhombeus]
MELQLTREAEADFSLEPTGVPQGCVLSPLLYTHFTHDCWSSQNNTSIIKFADDTTVVGLITGGDETAYRKEVAELVACTGVPQGCVLSPLLYTHFTHDCWSSQNNTSIIKFADDTTVVGLITGGDETAYRKEVAELVAWCHNTDTLTQTHIHTHTLTHNLSLNADKTKEMTVDPRRKRELHTPLYVGETEVERVKTFKFLGIHVSEDLTWSHNTHLIIRKFQQ